MNILMTKFPYSSAYGGGELHTITLVDALQKRGHVFHTVTNCSVLHPTMRKAGWRVKKWWVGREPVAKWSLAVFPLVAEAHTKRRM